MKKLLTGVLVASLLGTSVLGGVLTANANTANANVVPADHEDIEDNDSGNPQVRGIQTEGTVGFSPDEETPIIVDPPLCDPENQDCEDVDVDIPAIVPECDPGDTECEDNNGNFGPLTIAYAPTLRFGEHTTSLSDEKHPMIAEMQVLRSDSPEKEEVPYVSFVQIQDRRGTNEGWTLHLTSSAFVNAAGQSLVGEQIVFSDGRLVYNGAEDGKNFAPTKVLNEIKLNPGTEYGQVIMGAPKGHGAGISSLVWGDQAKLNEDHDDAGITEVLNDAINLHVPGTSPQNGSYTANLHWQLVAAPYNDNVEQ